MSAIVPINIKSIETMTQIKDIAWRIKIAKEIYEFYCEKTNAALCAKRAHALFGVYVCSVEYQTFTRYIRTEIPDKYQLPPWVVIGLRCMVLAHIKHPIPLSEDEANEFIDELEETL